MARLTEAERAALAPLVRELRASGLTWDEVADDPRVPVSAGTAWRLARAAEAEAAPTPPPARAARPAATLPDDVPAGDPFGFWLVELSCGHRRLALAKNLRAGGPPLHCLTRGCAARTLAIAAVTPWA